MGTFAQRMSQVSVSATLKVAAEAERLRRAGHNVVDFSAGEPDFPTPEHVKTAAKKAIDDNFTRYTAAAGMPELREAVCARYKSDYGVDITPAEVLMTVGGKQALFNAALALVDPGDEVVTHAPYWPTIPEQVKLVGGVPVIVSTKSEEGFAVKAEAIIAAMTPRTKAVILNSPGNPTGALIDEGAVAAIAEETARRGIWIIVDLCYEQLIYEPVPHNLPKVIFERNRDRAVLAGQRVEELCDDRLAVRVDRRAQGADVGLQRHPGPDHVEHHVDHAEGRAGSHHRTADGRARRCSTSIASAATTSTSG